MSAFTLRNYKHDTLLLNVSGTRDEDGCVIERVTVGSDMQDISHLFSGNTLASMADCIDARLTREAEENNAEVAGLSPRWGRYALTRSIQAH